MKKILLLLAIVIALVSCDDDKVFATPKTVNFTIADSANETSQIRVNDVVITNWDWKYDNKDAYSIQGTFVVQSNPIDVDMKDYQVVAAGKNKAGEDVTKTVMKGTLFNYQTVSIKSDILQSEIVMLKSVKIMVSNKNDQTNSRVIDVQ